MHLKGFIFVKENHFYEFPLSIIEKELTVGCLLTVCIFERFKYFNITKSEFEMHRTFFRLISHYTIVSCLVVDTSLILAKVLSH